MVRGVEIDTAFFDGNHAPQVSVEGCREDGEQADGIVTSPSYSGWEPVLEWQDCGPNRRHAWFVAPAMADKPVTHVRLRMCPDGGIARFRLYGQAVPVWPEDLSQEVELSAAVMGGVAIACSDEHFGRKENLLLPGRGVDMSDGWETKRSRGYHIDWAVIRLGAKGVVNRIVIDTAHYRGNFPQKVEVEGIMAPSLSNEEVLRLGPEHWYELLAPVPVGPDKEHEFGRGQLAYSRQPFTHLRLSMIPDGGIKRFRAFGMRA
jgi:allantoicase